MSEVDTYKIFRELEARRKRANPYTFYDKDELIDEILKDEDEIERLNNIINKLFEYLKENSKQPELFESDRYYEDILDKLQELLGSDK